MRGMTPTRWCLTLFAAFLSAALVLFLFDTVTGRGVAWLNNMVPVLFLLAGFMLPMAAAARAWEQRRIPVAMVVTMIVIGIAALLWAGMILDLGGLTIGSQDSACAAGMATALGAGAAFTGLLLVPNLSRVGPRVVRGIAVAAMLILSLQLTTWFGISWMLAHQDTWGTYWSNEFHEDMARAAGALGVLAAALGMTTWVLSHTRSLMGEAEIVEHLPFTFTCPRCGAKQSGETGGDGCDVCGLSITVVML